MPLSLRCGLLLLALILPGICAAQNFPTKPVKIIVGFPAGGPLDAGLAFLGADDFAESLAAEMPRWAKVVKDSGTKLD